MIITKITIDSIDKFIKLAKDLNVNGVVLKSLNLDFGKTLDDFQRLSLAKKYLPNNPDLVRYSLINGKVYLKKEILQMPCHEIFENVTVFSDGSIGLCCADINKRHAYGNINKTTLNDLVLSDDFIALRKRALARDLDICKICSFPGSYLFNQIVPIKS